MPDKELEIRRQFLDEAQDYLDNLENALIGLAGGTNVQAINAAMRSAHSIKGGAGMMGFQLLSQLSHRLEDNLKVIKTQKHAVDVNAELEQLLLDAVDCLRRTVTSDRRGETVDPTWLEQQALPIFDTLHERLGDPEEEDAASILSPEDSQDIVPLLFQTEVEGCLERLQSVLDGDRHCLYEETEILAQELDALGEMLQLPDFSQLCRTVLTQMEARPDAIEAIAQAALEAWRHTQQQVLAGNFTGLPTALDLDLAVSASPAVDGVAIPASAEPLPGEPGPETIDIFAAAAVEADMTADTAATLESDSIAQSWSDAIAQVDLDGGFEDWNLDNSPLQEADALAAWPDFGEQIANPDIASASDVEAEAGEGDIEPPLTDSLEGPAGYGAFIANPGSEGPPETALTGELLNRGDLPVSHSAGSEDQDGALVFPGGEALSGKPAFSSTIAVDDSGLMEVGDRSWPKTGEPTASDSGPQVKSGGGSAAGVGNTIPETDDATVRVPVRQLKQINDLFSELTIERNGLELYLKRLRRLLAALRQRIKTLDQTNVNLRSAYDRVATRVELEYAAPPRRGPSSGSSSGATAALTDEFDVLELDQYSDMHLLSQEVMETIVQIQEVTTDLEISMDDTDSSFRGLNKTAKQLQSKMTQLQMRPLSDILERFPRALRKMSLEHGKSAELKVIGGNLLIDRNILDALNEPLLHLLRNAFDHGIEDPKTRQAAGKPAKGTIEIQASHRNNRTIISIRDDGKGIDTDKIRARARQMGLDDMLLAAASEDELISLIFEPGFSTSSQVTDLSGRGVGMDVVRDGIKQLQGDISVDTTLNEGTTFTLSLPYTLSVTRVLLVESNDMMLAFPTDIVEEMISVSPDQVLNAMGGEAIEWEDQLVQFVRLRQWLQFNCPRSLERPETSPNIKTSTTLMVSHGDQIVGLQVGRCWGEQEVAIRYVEGNLPMPPGFSSCTILGDGRVVPMVNVAELLRWITSDERNRRPAAAQPSSPPVAMLATPDQPQTGYQLPGTVIPTISQKPAILIVDDSINVRRFLALTLEKAGYRVEQAKDGQDAVDQLSSGLPVQAVICDIEMPRLDGYGVLSRVKANSSLSHLPIAMLTSRSGDKHRKLAMSLGASAYFSKPYNEQILLQNLKQMVEATVHAPSR
ncbi:MAG: hybrid sensor histidine kinase/response regulator [Cyanobacteria bacterium P01_A01_bin.135]